ncbi:hypothetical protein FNJ07_17155 [Salmonella enterica subsp. salamae]|nr:hypothetical protein [Salmonella enterica subsp. salamae]ECE6400963.1 hypothetical protein [Salmonella enterica subsp. salamae]ECJ2336473.1 hypothetical protein [Salmonella enterica subsp. salamae]
MPVFFHPLITGDSSAHKRAFLSLGSRGCFEYPLLSPHRLVGVLLTSNFRLVFRKKNVLTFLHTLSSGDGVSVLEGRGSPVLIVERKLFILKIFLSTLSIKNTLCLILTAFVSQKKTFFWIISTAM